MKNNNKKQEAPARPAGSGVVFDWQTVGRAVKRAGL